MGGYWGIIGGMRELRELHVWIWKSGFDHSNDHVTAIQERKLSRLCNCRLTKIWPDVW